MARNKFGWLLISAKQPTNDIDDDDDDDDHESIVETLWTDCGGSHRLRHTYQSIKSHAIWMKELLVDFYLFPGDFEQMHECKCTKIERKESRNCGIFRYEIQLVNCIACRIVSICHKHRHFIVYKPAPLRL